MSGHSKWATIKHKKGAADQKRAKVFAKLIRQVEVAAREGGGDPAMNPALRTMLQKARDSSVPIDTIERAIKRGSGVGADSVEYLNIMYEAYGPNGVALMIECLTDNKNRAAADVRLALSRSGGTLADPGSVAYQFARKGVIVVPAENTNEDAVLEAVLDFAVDNVEDRGEQIVVTTDPSEMVAVRLALQNAGIDYESADVEFVASMDVQVDAETARKVIKMIDSLEDSDEVQNVYSNFDMSAEVMAELEND